MKKLRTFFVPFLIIIFPLFFLDACQTLSPPKFWVFTSEPMRNSSIYAYLELQEVFDSDGQIMIIGWMDVPQAGTYVMQLKMQDSKNELIYDLKKDVKSDEQDGKAYVYLHVSVPLSSDTIAKLSPGNLKIDIFCDNKYVLSKQIKYTPGSIINKNLPEVVVLPFYSSSGEIYKPQAKERMLNSMAYAFTNEIKRVAPDVIPHYVAEQKLNDISIKKCLNNLECRGKMKDLFGEAILIEGDVTIPKYEDQYHAIKLYVYNSKTNEFKEYRSMAAAIPGGYVQDCMREILQDVLYKQGLLAYLRGL